MFLVPPVFSGCWLTESDCNNSVSHSLLLLVQPLAIVLRGITNDSLDPTVDVWRTVTFPLLRKLGGEEAMADLSIKVTRRGSPPLVSSQ